MIGIILHNLFSRQINKFNVNLETKNVYAYTAPVFGVFFFFLPRLVTIYRSINTSNEFFVNINIKIL